MAVDEVGEGSLLGGAGKADSLKKRLAATTSASVINSETSRPPRKKPGPLAHDSLKQWRRLMFFIIYISFLNIYAIF